MPTFTARDHFPHSALTPLPLDEDPSFNTLQVIHQEINANAIAIPSRLGGGAYGHLAMVMTPAAYLALPNTVAWLAPIHPGANPVHPAGATAPQITEVNRAYLSNLEKFEVYNSTKTALKKQLLDAIPACYTESLKHPLLGYANVEPLAILQLLDTTHGTIDEDDLKANLDRMEATWSPTQPIEDLWNQILKAQQYAAGHDNITEKAAIRAAITNLEQSGVFTDGMKDWRKLTTLQQTWAAMRRLFDQANKERRRVLTSKEVGYVNAATHKAPPATKTAAVPTATMFYCWSHGLSHFSGHTSTSCNHPVEGHRKEATMENMLGGCCYIKRLPGERQIYKKPVFNRENRENQENADPNRR